MTTRLELFIENGDLSKQQLNAAGRMRMLLIIALAIIAMSLFSMYAVQSYLMLSLCVILIESNGKA